MSTAIEPADVPSDVPSFELELVFHKSILSIRP